MSNGEDGPRGCRPEELPEVIELIDSIFRIGSDQHIATDYPLVFTPSNVERLRIMAVDGKVVAHVAAVPRIAMAGPDRFGVAMIAHAGTHQQYRHRGYATRCLRDAHRVISDCGCSAAVLWTEEDTFRFYRYFGWEAVASQGEGFVLTVADRDRFRPADLNVSVLPYVDKRAIDELMKLHCTELWRIERDDRQARALFRLPKISVYWAENADSENACRQRAYLVRGTGSNKPGIIEAVGDRSAVEHLLHHATSLLDHGQKVQVVAPPIRPDGVPSTLSAVIIARSAGRRIALEQADGFGQQMIRLFSLTRFLQAINGYLQERAACGVEGELTLGCLEDGDAVRVRLAAGSATVEPALPEEAQMLCRQRLVQVLFGRHPESPEPSPSLRDESGLVENLFPYRIPIWEIDHC